MPLVPVVPEESEEVRIWKFQLEVKDFNRVKMPEKAQILSVAIQYDTICIWAVCPVASETFTRTFQLIGTGHPIHKAERRYIGTVVVGAFVWHVFEVL